MLWWDQTTDKSSALCLPSLLCKH
uniref:Uncharacterized protein n=1 Tax=Rhizophora mucronata TaxID=61149 RepID=A0A2P2PTT9_RHIMU